MSKDQPAWDSLEETVNEMIEAQHNALLSYGRRIIPTLTSEDMLQPNDYPQLEENSAFRYEEGILAGMLSVQAALRALRRDREVPSLKDQRE